VTGKRSRRLATLAAVLVLAAAGVPGLTMAQASADAVQPGPPGQLVGSAYPGPPQQDQDPDLVPATSSDASTVDSEAAMAAAARQARATGKAVPVDAASTETEQLLAKPGGGFTVRASTEPVRARRGAGFVPVDLMLVRHAGGTLSPKATAYGTVVFSGGGAGPLVRTTSGRAGLSLGWPGALPVPTVAGSTATYPDVLPGVDLTVSATAAGGFTEVVVVRTAAAARSLPTLGLGMTGTGGTLRPDGDGLTLDPGTGAAALHASPARMWDSSTTPRVRTPAVTPDRSDAGHPGLAAHVAAVGVRPGRDRLDLLPDRRLLRAKDTVLPVFIDPTFNWHPTTGGTPAFDEVKQGAPCNHVSLYNNASAAGDLGNLGVGVNHWDSCFGIEHAYYQWNLPHVIWGATINTATVNATETYTANCAATSLVNLHWTGGIGAGTTWNNRPGFITPGGVNAAVNFGPAGGNNCPSNPTVTHGFNVLAGIKRDAAAHAGQFTAVLMEDSNEAPGGDGGLGFKRFARNPTLQIEYDRVPATPAPNKLAAVTGANNAGCATSAPYPFVGKTVVSNTTVLSAVVSDPDADHLRATFRYWVDGSSTQTTQLSGDNLPSGSRAAANLAPAFVTALKAGNVVDWQVQVTDGQLTSGWSPVCHWNAQPTAPSQPTIVSADGRYPTSDTDDGTQVTGATAGTAGSFTITNNGTAATRFLYRLDVQPVLTNPPADQVKAVTNNTATVTVTPRTPGPHTLWVAAVDAAGDPSSMAAYRFIAGRHATVTCATLSACFNNTAISPDAAMTAGNADGGGRSFSATDLTSAGWASGGRLTVNGATYTLPGYGAGQADNVLAAGQNITLNQPVAGHGPSALTFLATATNSIVASPGADAQNTTTPFVPPGTGIASSYCFSGTNPSAFCVPQGQITFADGKVQTYDLPVPDWITGQWTLAAASFPHWNGATGQTTDPTRQPRIYPFAVPIRPDEAGGTITSVLLPDVADSIAAKQPQLHVFGMAVRNTTTAGAPTGKVWTAGWSAPTESAFNYEPNGLAYATMTVREVVQPTAAGSTVRLRLENPMNSAAVSIGKVTVAAGSSRISPTPTSGFTAATFGGAAGVKIPIGGAVYSDPVTFTANPGTAMLVSFTVTTAVPYLPWHSWASGAISWVTPPGAGDHTTDTSGTAFTTTGSFSGAFATVLSGVDVATTAAPATVVVGDGLVDVDSPNATPNVDAVRLSDVVGGIGAAAPASFVWGTTAAGIRNNSVVQETPSAHGGGAPYAGPSALGRLDRDILATPGVNTVVISEGLMDVLNGRGADDLTGDGYNQMFGFLAAANINMIVLGLPPCTGYNGGGATPNDPCTSTVDDTRTAVNAFLSGNPLGLNPFSTPALTYVDADAAVGVDPGTGRVQLGPNAARPDKANLSDAGYAALAGAVVSPLAVWPLADGATPSLTAVTAADDVIGNNPATLTGGATWSADASRGGVLATNGTDGGASTAGPVIDTAGGWSVAGWVELSAPAATATVAAQQGMAVPAFNLRARGGHWEVTAAAADSATAAAYTVTSSTATAASTWTHLAATYDLRTHTLRLYVNGAAAGSVVDPTPWTGSGTFDIGHAGAAGWFPGELSDLRAYNYALNPTQVTALYQQV
jgi:Concanavalin A-like lectin/glucanases superfamily